MTSEEIEREGSPTVQTIPLVERLRSYYVMAGGKPWFSNKTKVHRAADLHEAAALIERFCQIIKTAETGGFTPAIEQELMDLRAALTKQGD